MIIAITKAYTRHYSDNGQTRDYVEWIDEHGKTGRAEGDHASGHMNELFQRAKREGIQIRFERW